MKKYIFFTILCFEAIIALCQNVGIVRKNYFSTYFDSILNSNIQVFDSATIRLGSINPLTGSVSNIGSEYTSAINLNGATINPYSNRYYISSGFNLLTFDMGSGNIINNVPIMGAFPTSAFQNYRFNPTDSIIYGMIPSGGQNRFASINPATGQYSVIGNTSFNNIYTLAGNSIDPFQMLYYYSSVDSLIAVDLYTGAKYSAVPIQVPANSIFENIAYSCADTSIYAITRRNFITSVFDSTLMTFVDVIDSTTFKLSKINPNNGVVTFISPSNIGVGGNLTAGAFIDPSSMTYFLGHGNDIVGVSLITGLVTSSVQKTYQSGAFSFDMMRSSTNCYGAFKIRNSLTTALKEKKDMKFFGSVFPNPAENEIVIQSNASIKKIQIFDLTGKQIIESKDKTIAISNLTKGIYFAKVYMQNDDFFTSKFVKD